MRPRNRREYLQKCDRRQYRLPRREEQRERDLGQECFVPTIKAPLSPEAIHNLLRIQLNHARPPRPAKVRRVETVSWSGHYRGRKQATA